MSDDRQAAEWNVADWQGKTLVDVEGEKIGKLQDVYVELNYTPPDTESGRRLARR